MPKFEQVRKTDLPKNRIKRDEDLKSRYRYSDYGLEHRAVMAQKLGRPLRFDEKVHHKDNDGHNNADDNLVILTHKEHMRLHRAQGDIPTRPPVPPVEYTCRFCGKTFCRKRHIKPTPQYCGHACDMKAKHAAGMKHPRLGTGMAATDSRCKLCDAVIPFDRKKGNNQKRFCNQSCSMKYTRRDGYNPRGQYDWSGVFCAGCGQEFLPTRKQKTNIGHGRPVYCTRQCFVESKSTPGTT